MNLPDERPVTFFIGAGDCSACSGFTNDPVENWNAVRKELEKTGRVRVFEEKIPVMHSPVSARWPAGLNLYHRFYPAIILINGKTYNAALQNPQSPITAMVYGGILENGRIVADKSKNYPLNRAAIIGWVLANTGGPLRPEELQRVAPAAVPASSGQVSGYGETAPPRTGPDATEIPKNRTEFCSPKKGIVSRGAAYYL